MSKRDFTVDNHGSIFIVIPHTKGARKFIAENVQKDALGFGGGIVVEPRYVVDLVDGLRNNGFKVNE